MSETAVTPDRDAVPEPLDAEALPRSGALPLVIVAGVVGVLLAATIGLWAHYGTAVFFEIMRAGFMACFG